jgi:branched-chain amino acid aminotransferase
MPARARLALVEHAPPVLLDGVKSLSYAANMLAGRIARTRGFDEALLVDAAGAILEAPTASFFYVLEDGVLATPPLDAHILDSITRQLVMEELEVYERPVSATEALAAAREAFIASTTREIQPVAAIEDRELGEPGPRTVEATAAFRRVVARELGPPARGAGAHGLEA